MRATLAFVASAAALVPFCAAASETVTYGYDAKGRLIHVSHSGSINNGLTAMYAYDAADNRQSVHVLGAALVSPPPTDPDPSTPPSNPGGGHDPINPAGASGRAVVVPLNGLIVIPLS